MTIKEVLADIDSVACVIQEDRFGAMYRLGVLKGRLLAELDAEKAHEKALRDFVALIETGVAVGRDSR